MQIDSFNPNELTINRTLVGSTIDIVATASEDDAFTAIRALSTDDWDVEPIMLLDTDYGKCQIIKEDTKVKLPVTPFGVSGTSCYPYSTSIVPFGTMLVE